MGADLDVERIAGLLTGVSCSWFRGAALGGLQSSPLERVSEKWDLGGLACRTTEERGGSCRWSEGEGVDRLEEA